MSKGKIKIASIKLLSPIIVSMLDENSAVKIKITGDSMYPLFRSNVDSIVLKKQPSISKYDILLYKRKNGDYIVHRVVKLKNNALCMAGDNETIREYPIYTNQVIATVESFYRSGKHISCRNIVYKLYSFLWVMIMPIRPKAVNIFKTLRCAIKGRG